MSKDALIEMLWPDVNPRTGAISLKVAAHKLRSALGQGPKDADRERWIVVDNGTYNLNPAANVWVDTVEFKHHYERARRGINPAAELGEAELLYEGDLLEEDVYEDWTLLPREELRDLYLDVLQRLAQHAFKARTYGDVIRYCHKIVLVDPCREDAYRMLMQSHAALNQVARAGSWYAICRASLLNELGEAPSSQTVEAFERIFDRHADVRRLQAISH